MKKKKKSLIILTLAIAVLIIILIGATFAYFQAQGILNANVPAQVTTNTTDSLVFEVGKDISITADMNTFAEGMKNRSDSTFAKATLRANNKTNNATDKYNLFFVINENGLKHTTEDNQAELLLKVTKPDNTEVIDIEGLNYKTVTDGQGTELSGFDITGRTGGFKIAGDYLIESASEEIQKWDIEVTLVNLNADQTQNAGKNFTGNVLITKSNYESYKVAMINNSNIKKTANSISTSLVMEAGTEEIDKYYFAIKEVNEETNASPVARKMAILANESGFDLEYFESDTNIYTFSNLKEETIYKVYSYVKDKLGYNSNIYETEIKTNSSNFAVNIKNLHTGMQGENNIYYHTNTLVNGANDESYRYAGSYEDVENYVCFGTDGATCDNDHLYRIIGVFGSQVKLIKADFASNSQLGGVGFGSNSSLRDYPNYKGSLESIPSYYWCGIVNCTSNDWTSSKLNTNALNISFINSLGENWSNKIATTVWKVGGNTSLKIYTQNAPTAYQNEILNPAVNREYRSKIGFMYASDYMYGASQEHWTKVGISNNSNQDYRSATKDNWLYMGFYDWTITRRSDKSESAFRIDHEGAVNASYTRYTSGVRPVFYLNSDVKLISGTGTYSDPYRIN